MDRHVRALAILNLAFGLIGGLAAATMLALMNGLAGFIDWAEGSGGYGFLFLGSTLFHLAIAIPCILGGIFLLKLHEWARLLMIFVSALNVLNAPAGAAIGAYGLWVLLQPETEPLFLDPTFRGPRGPRRPPQNRNAGEAKPVPKQMRPTIKPARTNLPE